jgi:hypothetical protein
LAERRPPNVDLGGYLLGKLEPGERARFEQDLAGNPEAQAAAAELRGTVDLLEFAAEPYEVPAGLEARTFRALERAVAGEAGGRSLAAAPSRRRLLPRLRMPVRRLAIAGAAAVALGAAVFAGSELEGEDSPPGTLELETALRAPTGRSLAATATVRETGIGRVVSFDSSDLPILPKGDYYALWFVGPGDSPRSPNRISAGTFHPDPEGRSEVTFAAAVDPKKYPVLAVTKEAGDGDPSPTFPDVLRSPAR